MTNNLPPEVSGGISGPLISLDENLHRLAQLPLAFMPGTAWEYGMSIDVLGGALAAINASQLSDVVSRYVTGPLGMTDTLFAVKDASRLVTPYADDTPPRRMNDPESVVGEDGGITVFSPGRIDDGRAPQSGGAGMAGTARDLMKLLEALRVGNILKPATRSQKERRKAPLAGSEGFKAVSGFSLFQGLKRRIFASFMASAEWP